MQRSLDACDRRKDGSTALRKALILGPDMRADAAAKCAAASNAGRERRAKVATGPRWSKSTSGADQLIHTPEYLQVAYPFFLHHERR